MTARTLRGGSTTTSGTTWASATSATDGQPGVSNPGTYATWTNAVSGGTGYIEIGNFNWAAYIGPNDIINSVTITARTMVNHITNISAATFRPYDGATALGAAAVNCVRSIAANDATSTFPITLAQLRSANFKVRVTASHAANTTSAIFYVDHVDVEVDFTPMPTSSQSAYGFFADGTETGSVALAATSTPITQIDDILGLRIRLQSTYSVSTDINDDWRLQWEKNGDGNWADVTSSSTGVTAYNSTNLTGSGATTNRLGAGTGTFYAGLISENGLVSNFWLQANMFTELLYSIKIDPVLFNTGDVIRFRVLRNGATTGITYSQVPTLTVLSAAISQAAFGFYADSAGEAASTPLVSQDTALARNLTDANAPLVLRMRLQSTNAHAAPSTDDWRLQWEKNGNGTWTDLVEAGNDVVSHYSNYISDGSATTNRLTGGTGTFAAGRVGAYGVVNNVGITGNNFTELVWTVTLLYGSSLVDGDVVRFRVLNNGSTDKMIYTQVPSITVQRAQITQASYRLYFDGTESAALPMAEQGIGITMDVTDRDFDVAVRLLLQSTTSVGTQATTDWQLQWEKNGNGTWTSPSNQTVDWWNSGSLSSGNPTTNRLTGGSGTFEAGKVSEFGSITDVGITGTNFTEVLLTIKVKTVDLVDGDVIRLRLLRNNDSTARSMTYAQYPTLLAHKTALKTEALIDSFDTTVDKITKWVGSSPAVVWDASGRAKLPCTSTYSVLTTTFSAFTTDFDLDRGYNLTGSYLAAKITPPPVSESRETFMELIRYGTFNDKLSMFVSGSNLYARCTIAGVTTQVSIPYDPALHAWWKISERGGTIYMEYSVDGLNWHTLWVTTAGFMITTMWVKFASGYWGTESAADAYVDNVNVTPSGVPSVPVKLVRSGYTISSATTLDVDVTGGRTLFITRFGPAASISSDNAGVTVLSADGSGPNRTSVWAVAEGTSGVVRFTANTNYSWGYALVDQPVQDAAALMASTVSNGTADMGSITLTSTVTAPVLVFWSTTGTAVWSVADGFDVLDASLPASNNVSWNLGYRQTPIYAGPYVTPPVSRGREGSYMYELISAATLVPVAIPDVGKPKIWSGDLWLNKPTKVWNGSAWVTKPAKLWTGWDWKLLGDVSPRGLDIVHSGRGASLTYADVNVTGGRLLFIISSQAQASLTSNNAGVTLLAADTGGPRRNSIWAVAPGTTGVVRITGTVVGLWGYLLMSRPARDVNTAYISNNNTDVIESQILNVTAAPSHVVVLWNTNNSADWAVPPGFTMLQTIITQSSEPSWTIGYTTNKVPVGAYATPALSRGKNGTSRIELEAIASVV